MRIIARTRSKEYGCQHRGAKDWLNNWHDVVKRAKWENIADVRRTFCRADTVKVASGKSVVVFNVCGNDYRLVTAIDYNTGCIYVLWFGTHAEYDKNEWRARL